MNKLILAILTLLTLFSVGCRPTAEQVTVTEQIEIESTKFERVNPVTTTKEFSSPTQSPTMTSTSVQSGFAASEATATVTTPTERPATVTPTPSQTLPPTREMIASMPKELNLVAHHQELTGQALAIQGDYAYLGGEEGILILDMSDPTAPTLLKKYDTRSGVKAITLIGNAAYVNIGYGSLSVLDISDATTPQEVYTYPEVGTIEVVDQIAYMSGGTSGLHIFDVSTPTMPRQIGLYQRENVAIFDTAIKDNMVFVATGDNGLRMVDVSDPTMPEEISVYHFPADTPYHLRSVGFFDDTTIYVTGFRERVYVIDVSNPREPNQIGIVNWSDWGPDLIMIDDIAYFFSINGLCLVNFADLLNSEIIDCFDFENRLLETIEYHNPVVVENNLIYVSKDEEGLFIFSVAE